MEISERETLILAALLHDIGKFWQRTGEKYRVEYEEEIKDCCPYIEVRGIYTYRHVLWSGDFVDKYVGDKKVKNLVLYHHRPLNRLQKILALANDLSLGELFPEEGFQEMEQPDYYQTPLQSIFSETKVKPDKSIFNRKAYYFPLTKFSSPEHFSPETKFNLSKEKYLQLWRDFTQEISQLGEIKCFSTDYNTWYYVLKKYLSNIPAVPLKKVGEYSPDLSLFDHASTTAAMAVCLYDLNLKENELDEVLADFWHVHPPLSIGVERFAFIGGEISDHPLEGNSFLEQGSDPIIKGKFLYLRLLKRAVVKSILEFLDLPQMNLFYSGGRRFYLIAPLTKNAQLLEIKTEINQRLSCLHGGALKLSLVSVPVTMRDFIGTLGAGFGRCWKILLEALELDKNRAFKELATKKYSLIFAPISKGGKEIYCSICGTNRPIEKGDICGICASFEKLGQLGSASEILLERRIALDFDKDISSPVNFRDALEIFGVQYIFKKKQELAAIRADFDITVIVLNSLELSKVSAQLPSYYKQKEASKASFEFDFFPQWLPEKKKDQGKLQGVVRLDMDNLELIYSHGLGYRATLSRISTLSSLISIFFKVYLTSFIKDKYANDSSLLWADSNAVFISGNWDKVIEAAIAIREAFKKYTGEDGGFDLSAGLSFLAQNKPMSVGVTSSRWSLNEAKKKGGSFAFLGKTIAWDKLEDIERLKNILVFCLEIGKEGQRLPVEFLFELSNIYRLYKKAGGNSDTRETEDAAETANYQRWQLLLTFYLARMIERYPEFQTELGGIRGIIVKEGLIRDLDVVINWAGLSLEQ